ncbi:MAG TPA: LUD domain-containing protein [Negativicutes bacterium]|nr:LUD domain-containing protein [Negativicutes bacterium]
MVNSELKREIAEKLQDTVLQSALGRFAAAYPAARALAYANIDCEATRDAISALKSRSVENIRALADQFTAEAGKRGIHVFRAANGAAAQKYIIDLLTAKGLQRVIKSKSMVSEEIHLNDALMQAGFQVQETDLGEWIISLAGHRPSHMVMPAIHLDRRQIRNYFVKELNKAIPLDIAVMVQEARQALRQAFIRADAGISGANFGIAENGAIGLVTNEGNGRLTTTLPRLHIVLIGYDKLVAKLEDAAPIIRALPRSATGQLLTSYCTMISGPTLVPYEEEGEFKFVEKEIHYILLDNGRLNIADDPKFKQIYQCIRCASCLNVCPVYHLVGGHVYGHVYAGGIGVILTAFLNEQKEAATAQKIQELCLSCGCCKEICPGKIDIPGLIGEMRERFVQKEGLPFTLGIIFRQVMANRTLFHALLRLAYFAQTPVKSGKFIRHLPFFLSDMVKERSLPAIAAKPFRDLIGEIPEKPEKPRARAAFFSGCSIDFVYPEVGRSVLKVLQDLDIALVFPQAQTCCGAPVAGAGDRETLLNLARQNIIAFEQLNVDFIIAACPACTEYLGHKYKELFTDDPAWTARAEAFTHKIREFTQVVAGYYAQLEMLPPPSADHDGIKVTYHDSCHMKRALGISSEPRALLQAAEGYTYVEMKNADTCCGMSGAFGVKFPELSGQLAQKKFASIEASGAAVVAVSCPACLMQIRGILDKKAPHIKVKHLAEILAGR